MLEEAVHVIKELFTGKLVTRHGRYFEVDTARLCTLPAEPPPIYMSGFGEKAAGVAGVAGVAGRIADGFISTKPEPAFVREFREADGGGKPAQGGTKVCRAPDAGEARKTAHRLWPTDEVPGEMAQLLPLPRHFAGVTELVTPDMVSSPCGPDPEVHAKAIRAYIDAGFDEIYVNQIGPRQDEFFDFYAGRVLPLLRGN